MSCNEEAKRKLITDLGNGIDLMIEQELGDHERIDQISNTILRTVLQVLDGVDGYHVLKKEGNEYLKDDSLSADAVQLFDEMYPEHK